MLDLTLGGQYGEARRLMRSGELEGALTICRRILQSYPRYVGAYGVLGQICLQAGEHEVAANLFRRVLSADPENVLAYASLGAIYEERGLLEEAIWQLERALELSPTNGEIRRALRGLYDEHSISHMARIKMTRAGLARVYVRGGLYPKAIGELRAIVADKAYRFDLRVTLAEALWRDCRHEDAKVVCMGILDQLSNCLKANLILGRIWLNTDRDKEARRMFQKVQALDPENVTAQAVFGADSPLPPRKVRLPFEEQDAPPLDLPYLVDDEEPVSEDTIIEGSMLELPSSKAEAVPLMLAEGPLDSDVVETDEEQVLAPEVKPATDRISEKMSWLDVELRHLAEHPGDHRMRLALARKLSDVGKIAEAVGQYAYLVQQDGGTLLQVMRDLELLNRLYPGREALLTLLVSAREQAKVS